MNNLVVLYQSEEVSNDISFISWKKYCDKHNLKLINFNHVVNSKLDRLNQIFYFYKIIESNNLDVDNVMFVSDTTLVKTETDNLFKNYNKKLTFAEWDSDFGYLFNNIEIYNQIFFKKENIDFTKFFDFGFFITNKTHREIFEKIISFLENNYEQIVGKLDTTFIPQNFFFDCEYNKLSYTYNMIDMYRKEIVIDKNLYKLGNIFNFKNMENKELMMSSIINFL